MQQVLQHIESCTTNRRKGVWAFTLLLLQATVPMMMAMMTKSFRCSVVHL